MNRFLDPAAARAGGLRGAERPQARLQPPARSPRTIVIGVPQNPAQLTSLFALALLVGAPMLLLARPSGMPISDASTIDASRITHHASRIAPETWRLTPSGCCPGGRWAADGQRAIFYSKPADGPAGAWTADLAGNLAPFWPRFGYTAAGNSLIISAASDVTRVERLDGSLNLTLANGGVETLPTDGRQVAYLDRLRAGGRTGNSLERVTVAALDGGPPRGLLDVARADYLRWFPDGRRLAVFGWRPDGTSPRPLGGRNGHRQRRPDRRRQLPDRDRGRADGQWLAYLAMLQPNPDDNGVWVVRPDGGERRRLPTPAPSAGPPIARRCWRSRRRPAARRSTASIWRPAREPPWSAAIRSTSTSTPTTGRSRRMAATSSIVPRATGRSGRSALARDASPPVR